MMGYFSDAEMLIGYVGIPRHYIKDKKYVSEDDDIFKFIVAKMI